MRIKTKAILFLGTATLIVAALVVVYLEYFIRPSFQSEVLSNLHTVKEKNTGIYAAAVDGMKMHTIDWSSDGRMRKLAQVIVDPASSAKNKKASIDEFDTYLSESKMRYSPEVLIVDMLDQNGIVVASSREDRIGTDERKEEIESQAHYFSKAITANLGEIFIRSVVFEEDEDPRPMFHVVARMFKVAPDARGKLEPLPAVLLLHFVSLPKITGFLQSEHDEATEISANEEYVLIKKAKTLQTYLVNKDGIIVASTRSPEDVQTGKPITTIPVAECLTSGKEIARGYLDHRGVPVIGVSSCLKEDGLVILNEIEKGEAYGILSDLERKTTIMGGATFLAIVLLGFLVLSRFLRSINSVTAVAKWVSLGVFSERALVASKDEIGELAGTFNMMLDKIESSQKEIKQSEEKLWNKALTLENTLKEKEEQATFMEQSKRAIQNLLEDSEETKASLATESARLQTIISSIGDGLILIDGQYKIALVNPKAAELFSIPPSELLGKDLRSVVKLLKNKKGELPLAEWPTEEMFLTKQVVVADLEDEISLTTEKRTGGLPVTLSVAPLEGGAAGGVIVVRDVTEDRALDEAKSGFISVASHQLRTPLTTIRWYSEMLLSEDVGVVSDAQRDFLKEIHGGAERLYQTIDLLLGLSRVESGKIKSEPVPINLAFFSEEIAHELAPQVQEKKLVLQIVPPESQVIVSLDMLTFRQVILNLFSNAIRYTNDGGMIEVRWWVSGDGKEVTYSVHDNGIGIPEAQKSRIFSKFFRAENALEKIPDGSGLGLALVKELIEAWGGKVWFESAEGQGTTFFFTIPLKGETREH